MRQCRLGTMGVIPLLKILNVIMQLDIAVLNITLLLKLKHTHIWFIKIIHVKPSYHILAMNMKYYCIQSYQSEIIIYIKCY